MKEGLQAAEPAYPEMNPNEPQIDGILPKGPYPPCLRMADRAHLAGYPRLMTLSSQSRDRYWYSWNS